MAQIRFDIDDDFLEGLQKLTGVTKTSKLGGDALSLLKWAASEAKKGRVLITTNKEGSDPVKVVMPILEGVKEEEQNIKKK
ncbi:MAG TPA: hypothetical protein VKQ08_04785 [Cyclobacteriaceae bacterium]|nr:hypothetical protein [Cyclobacteriaceae bacterium]